VAEVLRICAQGSAPLGAGDVPVVALTDLAVLRGEAVFETMRVYAGRPFRLTEHLDRLARSAAAVDIDLDGFDLVKLAEQASEGADGGEAVLRLVCTKGPDPSGGAGARPQGVAYGLCTTVPEELEGERAAGLRLVLLTLAVDPLVRAASPWLLPAVKSTAYAVNMAAQRWARALGADEAVFTGLGGELLETPTANIWWRVGQVLRTPSLATGVLPGVTRLVVTELAPRLGYRVVDGVFGADDLAAADEVFLTSSVREVMPVVAVAPEPAAAVPGAPAHLRPVGDGRPGRAAAALQAALRRAASTV
jgi:4-amino-4-deoxychorismate lyase